MFTLSSPKNINECSNQSSSPNKVCGFNPSFEHSYSSPSLPPKSQSLVDLLFLEPDELDTLKSNSISISSKRSLSSSSSDHSYRKMTRCEVKMIETQINVENAQRESRNVYFKSLVAFLFDLIVFTVDGQVDVEWDTNGHMIDLPYP
ncbi:hypothetical protein BC833DRAFT_562576 [Globomyces pollinis-pini]|nr:hypothetical protein BC833DRAFT_562576 [Globomyces pollinis-pini]KAJ2993249.1 hypothetical protein HDV02_002561 [Globomyces sp. JEL0801]